MTTEIVTQAEAQALVQGVGGAQAAQVEAQALVTITPPPALASQLEAMVLDFAVSDMQISQVEVMVLAKQIKGCPARVIWVGGI